MQGKIKPAGAAFTGARHTLSIRGLTVLRKDRGRSRHLVLEDVSLSAQPGEITAILGAAGSGKTSLLAAIAGLLKAERGAVLVGGTDVTAMRAGRRGIGFLPPGLALEPGRSLESGLAVLAPSRRNRGGTLAALVEFGLSPGLVAGAASHGQGFAALAAARLLPDQPVLLVDEAGTGLDRHGLEVLCTVLRREAGGGRTVLIATRDPAIALAADHLVLLRGGHVLQTGTPASLYTEPRDEAAARLTGSANILRGTLRQKLPGGFIWVAAGQRFTQADGLGQPAPALGNAVSLCLRPAHLRVWHPALPNRLPAQIVTLTCHGDRTALRCDTPLGPLDALCDTPSPLRPAMAIDLGWDGSAASILAPLE
jgi:ABC-type Fe3+/spermidine/putrescine transport system ATPase subunit